MPSTAQRSETKTLVHVAGPWEIEYDDGKQRWAQRCLRCDKVLASAVTLASQAPSPPNIGFDVGDLIAVKFDKTDTATMRFLIRHRSLDPNLGERNCDYGG